LKEERMQIRILVGLCTLIVASDTDFEIDSPAAAFTALQRGTYRFGVDENGDSDAVVRKGELEAASDNFSRRIQDGEMVRVAMNEVDQPEYSRYDNKDEWDEWNDRRNADMNAYAGRKYLPDNVYIGVYDLYQNGRWVNAENYGLAWVPYGIDVSWAPYSTGRWCYRPFYGWTWISYEPWGWLPYHYGRWYRSSIYGWCWLPGPSFAFNFWSPALVTFYSGPGWISWCPLGPGDYYNIGHYHFNHGIYANQLVRLRALHTRAPGEPFYRGDRDAFRTTDIDQFRNGSFGAGPREARRRDVDQPWKQGEVVRNQLPVQPTTTSFRPAPERHAIGPERTAQALPAVVRNSPGVNLRGQEQFHRITNPVIPALPSRAERQMTGQRRGPQQGIEPLSNGRVLETPQSERANPGIQNQPGNSSAAQGGRRATTYRWVGTTENNREGTRPGGGSAPAVRSENNGSSGQQSSSGVVAKRPVPEQRKAQQPSSGVSPRIEEYHRPNGNIEQHSDTTGRRSNRSAGSAETPQTEGTRTYTTPRSESAPHSAPTGESAPSYAAPRRESPPSYSAPQQGERAPSHAAPPPSRGGGDPAPSSGGKSGASSSSGQSGTSSSSGQSGTSSSSGQSGGGDAHGHDKK
jgi:hypothetical protein